jgi:hypothetical protein
MTQTSAPINHGKLAVFELHLSRAYEDLFANDPEYQLAASRYRPSELACKMTLGLAKGDANKDGEGIRRACKAVGIKHTYKAIREYLTQPCA